MPSPQDTAKAEAVAIASHRAVFTSLIEVVSTPGHRYREKAIEALWREYSRRPGA